MIDKERNKYILKGHKANINCTNYLETIIFKKSVLFCNFKLYDSNLTLKVDKITAYSINVLIIFINSLNELFLFDTELIGVQISFFFSEYGEKFKHKS